jgi:excisionase family DNA binding protein
MDKFYTPEEIAERLKVSTKTVQAWLSKGQLKGFRAGKMWRVTREALEEFLKVPWDEAEGKK